MYGYDIDFFDKHNVGYIELSDTASRAKVLVVPDFQGRVMTSTADGMHGKSFGWINYDLIASKKKKPQFNPIGGEERFWLGPEGGPYSLYFDKNKEQEFANWRVPALLDTEPFRVAESSGSSLELIRNAVIENASGSFFSIRVKRTISILSKRNIEALLGFPMGENVKFVGYKSVNILINNGTNEWKKKSGLPSIWLLSMFAPGPATTVFIPFNTRGKGEIVNDEYFGKVPIDRLKIENGFIYFNVDGKHRSKIGVPYSRAKNICGSYDEKDKVLTLVWYNLPTKPKSYVNSRWGPQSDPYDGDVVNSYNDGPIEDGTVMDPFYEIETSSPGAELSPGKSLTHIQRIIHMQGDEKELDRIVNKRFGISLSDIARQF